MSNNVETPFLIPLSPGDFWLRMRTIVREEIAAYANKNSGTSFMETPGLVEKPLYKMQEICLLFRISKPTVYEWIKSGKLKKVKINSRVYFLGGNIRELLRSG